MSAALAGLFASAFLSATLLPGTSEIALAGVLAGGLASVGVAIAVATFGNTLGSLVNWGLGRFGATWREHPRFPVSPEKLARYEAWYARYGVWSLLMSWVPLIGDPLTVVAGLMRTPAPIVVALVALAKGARYAVVAGAVQLF